MGLFAVLLATVAWGWTTLCPVDWQSATPARWGVITLCQGYLVRGAVVTAALAVSTGEPWPSLSAALGLLAVGATGYSLSLRFTFLPSGRLAQRAQARWLLSRPSSRCCRGPFGFGDRPADC